MTYAIMGVNPGHNGSVALVVDGDLVYYAEEERLSRMKYDGNPFRVMLQVLVSQPIDELVIGGTTDQLPALPWTGEDAYTALVRKFNPNVKVTRYGGLHHLGHAASAFYGSGFESAAAVIIDGAGSVHQEALQDGSVQGFETETIYQCTYPHEFNAVYKRYSDGQNGQYFNNGIQEFDGSVTITKAYEAVSQYLGFGFIEAGKTMGLAPYGTPDENIPPFFVNGKGNRNLLKPLYPAGALIDDQRWPYLSLPANRNEWHSNELLVRDQDKNIAYHIQKETEAQVIQLIQKAIDSTGETNIVLSGGFALNCVANYKLLQAFPGITFYIDPIAHDGGTAIGIAKHAWYVRSKDSSIKPTTTLFLGARPDYNQLSLLESSLPTWSIGDTNAETIADLIADGHIVALFQGSAEAGPRALGNRSLLSDPREIDGKAKVNRVKGREWFRPFAGSVMLEHANEWFDLKEMKQSPFMMYAVDIREDKIDLIPAVSHVDLTCRVQTVSAEDNPAYYALIDAFRQKTGVPVLFNTSFNLAGQPLVESVVDALNALLNSEIQYLYLPDIGKLVTKNGKEV
jgi:carbamoyltransferase